MAFWNKKNTPAEAQRGYEKNNAEVAAQAQSNKQEIINSTAHLSASRKGIGTEAAPVTPGMGRRKPGQMKQQPQVNEGFRQDLKAHGHPVPESSSTSQSKRDYLREVQQAGAALKKAGARSDHSRDDSVKSAEHINKQLDQNNRGWNVNTDINELRKTEQNHQNHKQNQQTQGVDKKSPSMER